MKDAHSTSDGGYIAGPCKVLWPHQIPSVHEIAGRGWSFRFNYLKYGQWLFRMQQVETSRGGAKLVQVPAQKRLPGLIMPNIQLRSDVWARTMGP